MINKPVGPNQTELHKSGMVVFFSYETPVAAMLPSGRYIRSEQKYSRTTTKHVNQWLQGVTSAETVPQAQIDALL